MRAQKALNNFWRVLLWAVPLLSILWALTYYVYGDTVPIVRLISYVVPLLALVLAVIAAILIFANKTTPFLIYFAATCFVASTYFSAGDTFQTAMEGDCNLRVMTYSKMGRNKSFEAIAKVVFNEKPDILFMQEISDHEAIKSRLSKLYEPKRIFFGESGGGLIASQYRIRDFQLKRGLQKATIEIPGYTLNVWNFRAPKVFINDDAQRRFIDKVAAEYEEEDGPIIVAGDFNSTKLNYPYLRLDRTLDNAYEIAGSGFGFTFPTRARRMGLFGPFLRIDHIFISKHIGICRSYVAKDSGGSDHYPVIADLMVGDKE